MKIGLFGGTFNPIHYGHLMLLENVINELKLDKIYLLPTRVPPHKINRKIADLKDRLAMIRTFTLTNDLINISDYEYKNVKVNYTYDTLNHFKREFPEDEIFYIMGEDSFLNIETWKNYRDIIGKYNIIVFKRFNDSKESYRKIEELKDAKNIIFLDGIFNNISSTLIRNMIKENKSIRYLTSDDVIDIIKKRQLYV